MNALFRSFDTFRSVIPNICQPLRMKMKSINSAKMRFVYDIEKDSFMYRHPGLNHNRTKKGRSRTWRLKQTCWTDEKVTRRLKQLIMVRKTDY
jgi:ribosomal protein L35